MRSQRTLEAREPSGVASLEKKQPLPDYTDHSDVGSWPDGEDHAAYSRWADDGGNNLD